MNYYGVWVRSGKYQGVKPLWYSSANRLATGTLVHVELQHEVVPGIVVEISTKRPPIPKIKPITNTLELPKLPPRLLELAKWLQAYYPSSAGAIAQLLLPSSIPKKIVIKSASATKPPQNTQPHPLTQNQQEALATISSPNTYLLHGRTGSGKTRIYQELVNQSLADGRSALILTPEIGLTEQLSRAFAAFHPKQVVVLHSQLTPAERFQAWLRIQTAEVPLVIIGPRSVLFSPLTDIGLVVLDESHEPSYKQDQSPRYHATRVAARLTQIHNAILVHGTATPLVTDYYLAEHKNKPIIRLAESAKRHEFSELVTLVDLKERDQFTKSAYLSNSLIASIEQSLHEGMQSLLYLNRRGTARVALCQNCGWQALCPRCDLPLTYHGDTFALQCHVCGYHASVPTTCSDCTFPELLFRGIGTKAVVSEMDRLFPEARIMRFDSDVKKEDRLERHYQAIHQGDVDILVGTQGLAKGLDLPRLRTLGVIQADTSLSMPDYTAAERTYQLMNQVIGRVQRGHQATEAIIQTYNPDNLTLQSAISDDWEAFYKSELAERKQFTYPPFCSILKIGLRRATAKNAEKACLELANTIRQNHPSVTVDGPAPALHEKVQNKYEWQLILKSTSRADLTSIIGELPAGKHLVDIDPTNLL